jgi:hypothetical protein
MGFEEKSEKFLKEHGCTTWGGYNDPPLPYVECDINKFWDKFSMYGIRENEFRQVHLGKNHIENVHILIYHDCILMIKIDWEYKQESGYKYTPTCYLVGCNHEFTSVSDIRGNSKATCKICGYSYEYDCSD